MLKHNPKSNVCFILACSICLLVACGKAENIPADSATGVSVAELPLKRGFYVASDTPCKEASNATLQLLRRDGIGGARDFCEFKQIAQITPQQYQVSAMCGDLHGDENSGELLSITYNLTDSTSFSALSDTGWEYSARYCEQSSLPDPWRDNDISDLTQ
ncbi:MAG: hypothetical protein Q8K36_03700 [Alphaproteobacteria bacterium]|nr:hypothetical protein [Alphaproteobacteria bacterium]